MRLRLLIGSPLLLQELQLPLLLLPLALLLSTHPRAHAGGQRWRQPHS
jgi:hypothetical protein